MNDMQSVFDTATSAIILQGMRSEGKDKDGELMCLYRGPYGTKCAVGFLLSDADISDYEILENTNPHDFPSDLIEKLVPDTDVETGKEFLLELQSAHDMASGDFVKDFTWRANEVAAKYKLNPIK